MNNDANSPRQKGQNKWEMERLFNARGPFYHINSEHLESGLLFYCDQDKKAALAFLAVTVHELSADLLAYSLMSNHFHLLLAGCDPDSFFRLFAGKIEGYLVRHGHPGIKVPNTPSIVQIETLKQFRDSLAYVIRNEYVVNPNANPLSSLWCSGYLYFNELLKTTVSGLKKARAAEMSIPMHRKITKSRDMRLPPNALVWNDVVLPSSFVNFTLAESLFQDVRQFTIHVYKSVEAQIKTALALGEKPLTPDDELARVTFAHCQQTWGLKPGELSRAQLIELIKYLKYNYHSSNKQISRISGMPLRDVDTFFPHPDK